jgi:cell division protein FtsX
VRRAAGGAGSHLLTPPVAELTQLYGANFTLQGLSGTDIVALAAIGGALGWLGAKISVLIHLRRIG